ncbi:hypothetical protein [Streptomyces sp. NPDC049879]|uniref:hypothetical protein n=1 Tax=Streptomyces sp. NPDC049879 TaxID=3365598 RepID=UPI0037897D91
MDDVTLKGFRLGRGVRQVDIAQHWGVSQQRVGAVEAGPIPRLLVGTLADYVAAAGGRLVVGAEVAGGVMVPLYWRPEGEIRG